MTVDGCCLRKKSKTVDNILPTRNALIQNVKRAVYQAG